MGAAETLRGSNPPREHRHRPLRGRDAERRSLDDLCSRLVGDGGETLLVIEADAGMGKTRLLQELTTLTAASGIRVAVALCDPIAHDRPFGPLLEALGCERTSTDPRRRAAAEAAAALGAGPGTDELPARVTNTDLGARYGVQDVLVELLLDEAELAPVALVIDDAQWIDAATVSTLSAVVRRRGGRPVAVVLALRPAPRPVELDALLDRWGDDVRHLRLGPLPSEVVSDVAADLLGQAPPGELVRELERAGGNAFSVVQLTRAFASQGTVNLAGVRASIIARANALGPGATALLAAAAILGVDFTPDDLGLITGRDPYEVFDILYGAARTGLLVSHGRDFAFSHDLVAELLASETPEPLRVALHRTIVRRAAEIHLTPAVVAHHVMAASIADDVLSIDALCRAAAEVGGHDPHLALTFLDHADSLCGPACERKVEVALRRARVLCVLSRVTEAIDALTGALVVAPTPAATVQLRSARARCMHLLGDVAGAADEFERLARSGVMSPADEAAAWADVGTYRHWALQGMHPWDEAQRAIDLADRCGAVAPAVQALAAQASMAAMSGRLDLALELGERACARGVALPHHTVIPAPAFSLGVARLLADDLAGAAALLQGERVRIEQLGDPLLAVRPATALVIALYLAGDWDDVLAESEAIVGVCDDTGSAVGRLTARVLSGLIAHHRGRDDEADRALDEANRISGVSDAYAVPFLLQLQALRLEHHGEVAAAATLMADTCSLAATMAPPIRPWFTLDAVRLAERSGTAPTPGLLDGLTEGAAALHRPGPLGMAEIALGAERRDRALLTSGIGRIRRSPQPLHRSLGLELAGAALLRLGEIERGRDVLEDARTGYETLGAGPLVARIGSVLNPERRGRPTRVERPRFGWESLTPAELSVIRLLAGGARNGEIAERLVLSKRTVESHVSSMLVKLGVGTRVELANAANVRGQ